MNSTQKALLATEYKIESLKDQSGFFVRNLWKVIGFGIFISFWAPSFRSGSNAFRNQSALQVSDYGYFTLVIFTAIGYGLICFIIALAWRWQDKKQLEALMKKKAQLEIALSKN